MKRALVAVGLCVAACGSARRSEPLSGAIRPLDPEEQRGQVVFMRQCNQCHPGGDAGLGPGLNEKKAVPHALVRLQIRKGLGTMPSFDERRLPDPELDALLSYLSFLRGVPGP